MILEEYIIESIKKQAEELASIKKKWTLLEYDEKLKDLQNDLNKEGSWENPLHTDMLKEEKYLSHLQKTISRIEKNCIDIKEFIAHEENIDSEIEEEIRKTLKSQTKEIKELRISLLLNQENDNKNCFFDINSGAGGTEAQDWAEMLLRMYCRFFEMNNFKYKIINELRGEEAGIKSATVFVEGEYVCGLLESEIGIHRLVRISPFDANKKRHTSFAAVSVSPEIDDIKIKIDPKDLRVDTFRAGGAGGQHVNKTDSAVRITHIPTNIVVQCQNERSQLQNKEQAMKMLKSKLYKKEEAERQQAKDSISKKKIEWGSQIRSYILHPYKMVKDHQTDTESSQPEKVLDGEIMIFIESYLLQR